MSTLSKIIPHSKNMQGSLQEQGETFSPIQGMPKYILLKIFEILLRSNKKGFLCTISSVSKKWNRLSYHPIIWAPEIKILEMPETECLDEGFKANFLRRIASICAALDPFIKINGMKHVQRGSLHYLVFNGSKLLDTCRINQKRKQEGEFALNFAPANPDEKSFSFLEEIKHHYDCIKTYGDLGIFKDPCEMGNKLYELVKGMYFTVINYPYGVPGDHHIVIAVADHKCCNIGQCSRQYRPHFTYTAGEMSRQLFNLKHEMCHFKLNLL